MPEHRATQKVRSYLRRNAIVSEDVAQYLEDHLPLYWRRLIHRHGHAKVFECLRANRTLGGTLRELRRPSVSQGRT